MITNRFDFDKDIRLGVMKYLPYDRKNRAYVSFLESLPTPRLFIAFLSWRSRLICDVPRIVYRSAEINQGIFYTGRKQEIDHLFGKIRTGQSLQPHLSKRVLEGYLPRQPGMSLETNPSIDLLLNEWGMHHLHISNVAGHDGFNRRGKELLIAIFRADAAFCIDVVCHDSWTDQRLVEIVHRNWPKHALFTKLTGAVSLGKQYYPDRLKQARGSGYSTLIQVDQDVLMPAGGGISSDGTATRTVFMAQGILKRCDYYHENPDALVSEFQHRREFRGTEWPRRGVFKLQFIVTPNGFAAAVREMKTGHFLAI